MKNVVMLVIDALSYWYIQEYQKYYKNSFFHELEKSTYCTTQMYSSGPFTEAGLQGLFASQYPLDNQNYMAYFRHSNKTLLEVFCENGYQTYCGGHTTMFCDFQPDMMGCRTLDHYNYEGAVSYNLWRSRLNYFFGLYDSGRISEREKLLFSDIVEFLFECFCGGREEKQKEYEDFKKDRCSYIESFLLLKREHSFYKRFMNTEVLERNACKEMVMTDNIYQEPPNPLEAELCARIAVQNKKRFIEINRKFCESQPKYNQILERELAGSENRCIQSNNNLITHMRGNYETIPTIGRELNHFLNWLDEREEDTPYFSYIHVFDFHYQENVMENDGAYSDNLKMLLQELKTMPDMKMSVSKTLSILHIERQLRLFWEELKRRDFFENSFLIITADHGISNFMYPICASGTERWAYNRTNFNIPFYMAGKGIPVEKNERLLENLDIPVTLLDTAGIPIPEGYKGKNFFSGNAVHQEVCTEWTNGCPNIAREAIKFGIRNENYSMTWTSTLNEFVDSGQCVAVYDLQEDPDETMNLANTGLGRKVVGEFLPMIRQRWFNLLYHYYMDFEERYFPKNRVYKMLHTDPQKIQNWMEEQGGCSWEDFCREAAGKKIILMGASEYAKEFVASNVLNAAIYEIWDNDAKKEGTYFMGHIVKTPYSMGDEAEECIFIITNRYEIETRIQLDELHLQRVYIGRQIIRGKIR